VIPVVTSEQMKMVDRAATEPVETLIGRAGAAVARAALRELRRLGRPGGSYGRRVVVVAGKGNNGADGRAAASRLVRRGIRVAVVDAGSAPRKLGRADLVIDAAYGTGFHGSYEPPEPGDAPVLAVDIPSGVPGDTGVPEGGAIQAAVTVTFAAYKPGLLLGSGPALAGKVEVADIGLGAGVADVASAWLVSDDDVAARLPRRDRDAHKWQTAVAVVAGSPGMMGAPSLVSRGAMRAGAGYVRLGVPGASLASLPTTEAVGLGLPPAEWDDEVLEAAARCHAIVIGPGLGRSGTVRAAVRRVISGAPVPVVVDADGLNALGSASDLRSATDASGGTVIITPHEGEYARLFGGKPGPDRLAAVREAASSTGAIVLLKGSTTLVAAPDGRALFAAAGSPRLATAGTGDVLSGVIGAFVARGMPAFEAAGLAAHVHGRAAGTGFAEGLVAGELPELVARFLSHTLREQDPGL
jgi:NAD(P)H-hydrate epimerase